MFHDGTVTFDAVGNRTFHELFIEPVRFVVPFFQRGYAWQRRQWDDLFHDLAHQVQAEIDRGTPLEEVEHFFGPVVVQRRGQSEGSEAAEYMVIDGQQRLTTAYVLLGLIADRLAKRQHADMEAAMALERLKPYLANETPSGDDYQKLKVFSTKGDRLSTYRAVFGSGAKPDSPYYAADAELFAANGSLLEDFAKYLERPFRYQYNTPEKLWRLAQMVLHCLKIVWIPLDERKDDPQAIFESLNDRGMALTSSELICSYLFRPLMEGGDFEELHNQYWLAALKAIGPGQAFEDYLRYLLSIGEKSMVGAGRKTYVHFKMKHRELTAKEARRQLASIRDNAPYYNLVAEPAKHPHSIPAVVELLYAIHQTGMDSPTPFLMACVRAHAAGDMSAATLQKLLMETLTLLVRRKMAEAPTSAYDRLFPSLFGKVAAAKSPVKAMHEQIRKLDLWVSDEDFVEAFVRKPLYRPRDPAFGLMVLSALDAQLNPKSGDIDYTAFEHVEHVVPAELDRKWKEYLGSDWRDDHMSVAVHTAGNLCLAFEPKEPGEGKDPFAARATTLSLLTEGGAFFRRHRGAWNLAAIRKRSGMLAKEAMELWRWGV